MKNLILKTVADALEEHYFKDIVARERSGPAGSRTIQSLYSVLKKAQTDEPDEQPPRQDVYNKGTEVMSKVTIAWTQNLRYPHITDGQCDLCDDETRCFTYTDTAGMGKEYVCKACLQEAAKLVEYFEPDEKPPKKQSESCGNCKFGVDMGGMTGHVCCAHPPTYSPDGTHYPEVGQDLWCGEWRTK